MYPGTYHKEGIHDDYGVVRIALSVLLLFFFGLPGSSTVVEGTTRRC